MAVISLREQSSNTWLQMHAVEGAGSPEYEERFQASLLQFDLHVSTPILAAPVQVVDMEGVSSKQMIGHTRSADSQQELQHNQDFQPEMISKVKAFILWHDERC